MQGSRQTHISGQVEKLRVLMLGPTQVPGGITTWLRILLKYSDKSRLEYRVIPTDKLYDPMGKKLGARGAILGLYDGFVRILKVLRTARSFHPDLVYITCSPSIGTAVRDAPMIWLLRVLGVPVVIHLHGGDVSGFFGVSVFRKMLLRPALRRCRAVLVLTRQVEEAARKLLDPSKVFYVPNMIDDELLDEPIRRAESTSPGRPFNILHVAWLAREKGTFEFVQAMKYVSQAAKCRMVGIASPENERLIRSMIAEYGLEERVELMGVKRGQDLYDMFRQADLFVLPTHQEGFPMVLTEAMTFCVPIVASDVGNIREMIGADTDRPAGVLLEHVAPVDPRVLASKIDGLLVDSEARKKMAANGRWRVETFYKAEKVVFDLETLLRLLCGLDE